MRQGYETSNTTMSWSPLNIGPVYMRNLSGACSLSAMTLFMNHPSSMMRESNICMTGEKMCGKSIFMNAIKDFFGGGKMNVKTTSTFVPNDLKRASVLLSDEFPDMSTVVTDKIDKFKEFFDINTPIDTEVKYQDAEQCLRYIPWIISSNNDLRGCTNKNVSVDSMTALKS